MCSIAHSTNAVEAIFTAAVIVEELRGRGERLLALGTAFQWYNFTHGTTSNVVSGLGSVSSTPSHNHI
jgi:hypothetical protein